MQGDLFILVEGEFGGGASHGFSLGLVYDFDHPFDSGVFRTPLHGIGVGAGIAAGAGYVAGDIEGRGYEADVNLAGVSPSFLFNDQGDFHGGSLTTGPGIGAAGLGGDTTTWTIWDL